MIPKNGKAKELGVVNANFIRKQLFLRLFTPTRFILPVEMCAVLSFEAWGRKMGSQDIFLGRVSPYTSRLFCFSLVVSCLI